MSLLLLVWSVFGQTLWHGFADMDDDKYVFENPAVLGGLSGQAWRWAFTHAHGANWHPLTTLTHMADCSLYGLQPWGHHLTNVLLHSLAVVLVFLALRAMTKECWLSAWVAAAFAIHPLRAESVAWIAERKDVLSGVFFPLTLLAYIHFARRPSSVPRYLLTVGCFVLGLLCKPILVTLPFLLLLLDYWPLERFRHVKLNRLVGEKVPFLVLSLGSCIVTYAVQSGAQAMEAGKLLPLPMRIANALVSGVVYLRQSACPFGLAPYYPYAASNALYWQGALSLLVLVAVSAAVVRWRRPRPYLLVGWLWFLGTLVPVIGLVQVGAQAHADRYTYLAQIGLLVALGWGARELCRQFRLPAGLGRGASLIIIGGLAVLAFRQTGFWRDNEALWRHALAVTSENPFADEKLALAVLPKGKVGEAITLFEHAEPMDVEVQNNLAWCLTVAEPLSLRDPNQALNLARQANERTGGVNPVVLHTLAAAYAAGGRFPEAVETAQRGKDLSTQEGNVGLAEAFRRELELYQARNPWRPPVR